MIAIYFTGTEAEYNQFIGFLATSTHKMFIKIMYLANSRMISSEHL